MVPALSSTKPIRSWAHSRASSNQHNVSWRTGLDWNPTDTLLAYFDVAKGFKAGSFPALSGSTSVAYTPVTQESVLTYEGGIKTQLLDRRLSLNLSAFHSDYKDKQVKSKLNDPIFGPLDALVNIPKSVIKGVELETAFHPMMGLTLGANVTYLDAKLVEANGIIDLYERRRATGAATRYPTRPNGMPAPTRTTLFRWALPRASSAGRSTIAR